MKSIKRVEQLLDLGMSFDGSAFTIGEGDNLIYLAYTDVVIMSDGEFIDLTTGLKFKLSVKKDEQWIPLTPEDRLNYHNHLELFDLSNREHIRCDRYFTNDYWVFRGVDSEGKRVIGIRDCKSDTLLSIPDKGYDLKMILDILSNMLCFTLLGSLEGAEYI